MRKVKGYEIVAGKKRQMIDVGDRAIDEEMPQVGEVIVQEILEDGTAWVVTSRGDVLPSHIKALKKVTSEREAQDEVVVGESGEIRDLATDGIGATEYKHKKERKAEDMLRKVLEKC